MTKPLTTITQEEAAKLVQDKRATFLPDDEDKKFLFVGDVMWFKPYLRKDYEPFFVPHDDQKDAWGFYR